MIERGESERSSALGLRFREPEQQGVEHVEQFSVRIVEEVVEESAVGSISTDNLEPRVMCGCAFDGVRFRYFDGQFRFVSG
jgi:hypothetical protein